MNQNCRKALTGPLFREQNLSGHRWALRCLLSQWIHTRKIWDGCPERISSSPKANLPNWQKTLHQAFLPRTHIGNHDILLHWITSSKVPSVFNEQVICNRQGKQIKENSPLKPCFCALNGLSTAQEELLNTIFRACTKGSYLTSGNLLGCQVYSFCDLILYQCRMYKHDCTDDHSKNISWKQDTYKKPLKFPRYLIIKHIIYTAFASLHIIL